MEEHQKEDAKVLGDTQEEQIFVAEAEPDTAH